jgi:hypothetical protein
MDGHADLAKTQEAQKPCAFCVFAQGPAAFAVIANTLGHA